MPLGHASSAGALSPVLSRPYDTLVPWGSEFVSFFRVSRSVHRYGFALAVAAGTSCEAGPAAGLVLTCDDAIRLAVERSPEVRGAAAQKALAGTREPAIMALTDPRFVAEGFRAIDKSPQVVPQFFGTRTVRDSLSLGFRKQTLIGTSLSLDLEATRQDSDAAFSSLNPAVDSSLSLNFRQALVKNLLGRPDRAKRSEARAEVRVALARLEQARNSAAIAGAEAFLDFVAADREKALRQEAVADAQRFLDKIKEKLDFSLVEESDMTQARVNLELRHLEAESAESGRRQARLRLLTAISDVAALASDEEITVEWSFPAVPPPVETPPLEDALAARPDAAALRAREEAAEASLKLAELDRYPSLDAIGSYGFGGLDTSHPASFRDLRGWGHPTWAAGLALTVPLSSARERVAVEIAAQGLEMARADRSRHESLARLEILGTRERVELARRHLEAAENIVALQQRKLEAERRSFDRGRSTTEVLIRFAEEERGARRQILHARIELTKALLALRHSQGEAVGPR